MPRWGADGGEWRRDSYRARYSASESPPLDHLLRDFQGALHPCKGFVTSEDGEALEDAGGDGRPGDRHADRLEDLAGLDAVALDAPAQRALDALDGPRIH